MSCPIEAIGPDMNTFHSSGRKKAMGLAGLLIAWAGRTSGISRHTVGPATGPQTSS
jgi:hypothetical protein